MRNPLTLALAAMALHTLAGVALGWPYPSVATFLAGFLAVAWTPRGKPGKKPAALGTMAGLAVLAPSVVPLALFASALAGIAVTVGGRGRDPLGNATVALPALTMLVIGLTV